MIKIGWIDFSNEDREKTMSVIDLMKESEAVDELGIGTIRDRLADLLFPGTSTIQTRAKYFFIVPWCMIEAEKKYKTKKKFKEDLNKLEVDIIYKLIENEDEDVKGLIGRDSKEKLKRKPSSIYWNGLKTYKIMPLNMSMTQYIDSIEYRNKNSKFIEAEDNDDIDSGFLETDKFHWNILLPEDNWQDRITFTLSRDESLFLRNTIISTNPNSLYAFILNNCKDGISKAEDLYDLEFRDLLPNDIREILDLALNFGEIIHGAHIRYNIILRNKNLVDCDDYEELWNRWCDYMKSFEWDTFNEEKLYQLTNIQDKTKYFVQTWIDIAKDIDNKDINLIDKLIEDREYSLKGARSKIKNYSKVDLSKWIGLGLLNYRWNNVKTIVNDINQGGRSNA